MMCKLAPLALLVCVMLCAGAVIADPALAQTPTEVGNNFRKATTGFFLPAIMVIAGVISTVALVQRAWPVALSALGLGLLATGFFTVPGDIQKAMGAFVKQVVGGA